MPLRPPPSRGERGSANDLPVVRRIPIAMSLALEIVAELQVRERECIGRFIDDGVVRPVARRRSGRERA